MSKEIIKYGSNLSTPQKKPKALIREDIHVPKQVSQNFSLKNILLLTRKLSSK
jgi:hypothetical protein